MKKGFVHYYFLISCPGDVQDDIKIITEATADVNKRIGDPLGIHLVTLYWKEDAIPEVGGSAQTVINKQLLEKADGVIALFWTRFGTPTDEYGSGTEEEIEKAISDHKDVKLYCSNKPVTPSQMKDEQYQKVVAFKNKYPGLFAEYNTEDELRKKLTDALTNLVFRYAKGQKDTTSAETGWENKDISEYTLAEYFDLGWYLSRSHFETPDDGDSFDTQKNLFATRLSMLLTLSKRMKLIGVKEIETLDAYHNNMMKLGLKRYVASVGKEVFEKAHDLLNKCSYGLLKKLRKRESAAFQLGMHFGRYALLIEFEWFEANEHDKKSIKDLDNVFLEANNEYQKMQQHAKHIDNGICELLQDIKLEENLEMSVSDYHEKMCKQAETVMSELQMH